MDRWSLGDDVMFHPKSAGCLGEVKCGDVGKFGEEHIELVSRN